MFAKYYCNPKEECKTGVTDLCRHWSL